MQKIKTRLLCPGYARFVMVIVLGVLLSCNDEPTSAWQIPTDNATALEGSWQSVGYGRVLDIRDGVATLFDIAEGGCVSRSVFFDATGFDVADWNIEVNNSGTEFRYHAKATVNIYHFLKIDALPTGCENGGLRTNDAIANFDYLWSVFQEHYAFFEHRNVDWNALKDEYRNQVNSENLWNVLVTMLSAFQEDHVTLTGNDGSEFKAGQERLFARFYQEYLEAGEPGDFNTYVQTEYAKLMGNIQAHYLNGSVKSGANDKVFWGKLSENIGYLHILEMSGYSGSPDFEQQMSSLQATLNEAMEDLETFDKIVIDVRFNSGGFDRASLEIAGRFATQETAVWNIQARDGMSFTATQSVTIKPERPAQTEKQILVLTSQFTASAAETFTLAMKQFAFVKTIGENTNGIFSTMLEKEMPNNWHFTLSNERWTDPSGNTYEVTGITPDVAVAFPSPEQRNNGVDPVLEKAMEHLE